MLTEGQLNAMRARAELSHQALSEAHEAVREASAERRMCVKILLCNGVSYGAIAKMLKVSRSTVQSIVR